METLIWREVTRENWRATLSLAVHPDQQRFVADYAPIASLALAKAYVRPGGLTWTPYALYAANEPVGFVVLAYEPGSHDDYWIHHFFIDHRYQGQGYGKAGLSRLIERMRSDHPRAQSVSLTVHPENLLARRLYAGVGFRSTETEHWGEPAYRLALCDVG